MNSSITEYCNNTNNVGKQKLLFPVFFHYFSAELPAHMNSYISEDILKEKLRLTSKKKTAACVKITLLLCSE